MKKLILLIFVLYAGMALGQQRLTFSPTTNDSIVGAATKYCTLTNPITQKWTGCIEVYITPSVSSSDSTHVWIEASQDGSTWYKVKNFNAAEPTGGGTYYATNAVMAAAGYDYKGRMGTTASGWLWTTNDYIQYPYLRVAVQHFKAATSVKITRAKIYLKK